jgi:hypothetical protein
MAAPTKLQDVSKVLANPEPSTHGTTRQLQAITAPAAVQRRAAVSGSLDQLISPARPSASPPVASLSFLTHYSGVRSRVSGLDAVMLDEISVE